jgi:membrane associated rhomboid family serine protease
MLDFSSSGPPPREPAFSIPFAAVALVAALLLIHAVLDFSTPGTQTAAVLDFGFIPGRETLALWPGRLATLLLQSGSDPKALDSMQLWRATTATHPGLKPWTFVTYAFLHGSWTHVGLNCIWLTAFGPPLARRFGTLRYFGFFLATSACGAALHWAATPMDFTPLIGASGAASGFMAGAARFMFQPGEPLGRGPRRIAPERAASLYEVFTDSRALIFVGVWLATNVIFGAGAQTLGLSDEPVAWIAHIGGFVGGLALFPLFDGWGWKRRRA